MFMMLETRAVLKLLHNSDVLVQVRVPLPCGRPWLSRLPVLLSSLPETALMFSSSCEGP